jgi:hypothetical protein
MQKNEVNFKALTFISEQTASTFNYEVKGVRALWDPSLSIPGTNRRGGWRCPVGTRYGGQITDRFGRSCGWGVARRIANQIADIGERLENIDDRKRNNRLAKRNARMQRLLARQQKPGLLERGARGVAEALDGGQPPQLPVADIDSVPPRPRRRRGNLRESEQRRMERELVEPGAPRTGEPPQPNLPRGRRRAATQQGARRTARRKPEADFVDGAKPAPTVIPQRKPPSAPPKPLVVEPDPNFNAPDLGGSLPDIRSERNVRNRFRERGLPDTAYWREDAYQGDDKAELERRFGRYYNDNNQRNARGDYVNRKIKKETNPPAQPRSQPPQPLAQVEPTPASRRPLSQARVIRIPPRLPRPPAPRAPARPKTPDAPKEPKAPAGPPQMRRVLDLDGEFNKPQDQDLVRLIKEDIENFKPNAYNNLRGLDKDALKAKQNELKREQELLDQDFDTAMYQWAQKKNDGEEARQLQRNIMLGIHGRREKNFDEQKAVDLRIVEIDAGIPFEQKLPKQLPANQAPRAQPPQPPAPPRFELKPLPANPDPDNPFDRMESKEIFEQLNSNKAWVKKARKYLNGEGPAPRNFEQMQGNAPGVSEARTRAELKDKLAAIKRMEESLKKRGYADAEEARLEFGRAKKAPKPPARAQTPAAPVAPPVSTASEIIPDDKIVPDSDAGGKAPRRIGRAQKLDDAVKALHENRGDLHDIPDGIVIDAVIDGEFKDVGANRVLTNAEVAKELKNGFRQRPKGSEFENRRYKFKVQKNSSNIADVWVVLEVEDKISGEKWFMKSSTYGDNDALLENVGMNAAQALEFGNNENHLRIGEILQNDPRINGAPPKPRRWIMMKDIAQWQNGVQGNWKDAKNGLDRVAADINPRDVGRILALDMVLDNQDRHGGNFMWARDGNRVRLGLIDHGLIGGGRQGGASGRASWAAEIIRDPGARRYANETNNGIEGLRLAGYRVQNQRDARILKETLKRSVARLKRDLDKITGGERIEANGAKLSDAEKAHLALVKSVAEARIGWMENNLDVIVDFLR